MKDLGDGSLMEVVKCFTNMSGKIAHGQDALGKINPN
jgi:hypothetical protein